VREVENLVVLHDLAARHEIDAQCIAVWADGPDARGIDAALLYHSKRVTVLGYEQRQGCTGLVDGLGPDGNLDVMDPHRDFTCDTDGDGVLDGNRVFCRLPLLAHLVNRLEHTRRMSAPSRPFCAAMARSYHSLNR
jgi:hypothetical protein